MSRSSQPDWVPTVLFRLTVGASGLLLLLVLLAPLFVQWGIAGYNGPRLLAVFAEDAVLRRTALASAMGLMVTACVFFKQPGKPWQPQQRRGKDSPPPTIGA